MAALEGLQIFAPLGHALGLKAAASGLEDRCFQVLFPESYSRTATWLREHAATASSLLDACKQQLHEAVLADPRFDELAGGLEVRARCTTHGR